MFRCLTTFCFLFFVSHIIVFFFLIEFEASQWISTVSSFEVLVRTLCDFEIGKSYFLWAIRSPPRDSDARKFLLSRLNCFSTDVYCVLRGESHSSRVRKFQILRYQMDCISCYTFHMVFYDNQGLKN